MRIQVIFSETSVLVPCGDGKISVRELVDKAIVRFKKVLDKHPDDVIEVRSLRLADSGSFVALDDEVADILEDKEVVLLDYELIPHYIQTPDDEDEDDSSTLPPDTSTSSHPYPTDDLSNEDHAPFTNDMCHDPLIPSALDKDFGSAELGIANSNHASQELHPLEQLEGVDPSATPITLHIGTSRASQDIELGTQPWHSEDSSLQSQDPSSPSLPRKSEWRTSSDTGYKSQESYSQSQPKSQETFHHNGSTDGLNFSNHSSSIHQEHGDFPHHASPHHNQSQIEFRDTKSSIGDLRHTSSQDHHFLNSRKDDAHSSKTIIDPLQNIPPSSTSYGSRDDTTRFSHQMIDSYGSPARQPYYPHYPHGMGGAGPEYPPMGRGYDLHHSWGYGNFPPPHSEDGALYDRRFEHLKRRSLSMYSGDHGPFHGGPYPSTPPGPGGPPGIPVLPGPYGGYPAYADFYDPRSSGGRYPPGPPRSLDPHYLSSQQRIGRAYSHDRVDLIPPAGARTRPMMGPHGLEEETHNPPMDMFLSQPTTNFNYDQMGAYGGVPMITPPGAPLYGEPRYAAMGGPSAGVSLSQPGIMFSHRPGHGMREMDPYGHHPLIGGDKASQGRAGSSKSMEGVLDRRVDTPIDEEIDVDVEEEEQEGKFKGRPFQRDFRKSIFRDGSVYSQWMERMYEYDIQEENSDIPQFEGEVAMPPQETSSDDPLGEGTLEGEESGEEDEEFGNVHIVELHKCGEPLGAQLTHYTSPGGIDLGVFIASMDESGFAAKSGKLQIQDRILACNGCDFTKNMTNKHVEEVFTEMMKDPLLRMAISRGGLKNNLQGSAVELVSKVGVASPGAEAGGEEGGDEVGTVSKDAMREKLEGSVVEMNSEDSEDKRRRSIKTVAPPAAPSQAASLALTNTRQMGVRHTIQLERGDRGYGFGLTSRDVRTDEQNQPIYVKAVHHGGSAYTDGRLRIGDRLLKVNDTDVSGLSRPEVVQLLRNAKESVTLVISRQEVVEEQEEEEQSPPIDEGSSQPLTVNKTVLNLDIPLHNSGPAGLGVTVYAKSTSSRVGGEMGVYIKSIVPGGAAAMDGRLHKNDQVLSVNSQHLLGHSNQEAMDILRHAMTGSNTVRLVVARRITPQSPSMAALGEEPEEEEKEGEKNTSREDHEVGIDVVPSGAGGNTPSSSSSRTTHHSSHAASNASNSMTDMLASGSGTNLLASGSGTNLLRPVGSTTSLQSQTSIEHDHRVRTYSIQAALSSTSEQEPSRGSMRGRAATLATSSPKHRRSSGPGGTEYNPNSSPLLRTTKTLRRSQDLLGSGEILYDRLEPRPPSSSPTHSLPLPSLHPSSFSSLYDEAASSVPMERNTDSSLDHTDRTSLDYRGLSRYSSQTSSASTSASNTLRSHPPHMSRDLTGDGATASRQPISPSDIDYQLFSPTSSTSSRENTMPRQHMPNPPYPNHTPNHTTPFADPALSGAIIGHMATDMGMTDAPIRGSGRKDRNRPERGSGRNHVSQSSSGSGSGLSSVSPELLMTNKFATLPRLVPHHGSQASGGQATPTDQESASAHGSLENLRLSDSESNMAFRRDNPGRISITKKTKKNPRQDLAHLRFDDSAPLVEGEKPLMRAGSDSFLNDHNTSQQAEFMEGLEIGPSLGMVKSSSLESLHNVMHHTIKRDMVNDGSELRSRSTRNSFKQAVDHSYDDSAQRNGGEQKGVDVDFKLESTSSMPAMISFTKSLHGNKTKKKSFLQKVFKKRKTTKKDKTSPENSRKPQGTSMEISPASLTAKQRDELMRRYTLQLRPSAQTGHQSSSHQPTASEIRFSSLPSGNRHSMPVMDDYDSPGSPDEVLLASMAKV